METKTCSRCGPPAQPVSSFYARKARGKTYLRDECKNCCKAISEKYRDAFNAARKARRASNPTAGRSASELTQVPPERRPRIALASLPEEIRRGLYSIIWMGVIRKRRTRKPKYAPFKKLELKIRAAKGLCSRRNCPERAVSQKLCPQHLREKSQLEIDSRKRRKDIEIRRQNANTDSND